MRFQVADRNRFKFFKKIIRGCHLLQRQATGGPWCNFNGPQRNSDII